MVGGGPGAFIGDVHRRALRMDGLGTLVAGAFSSDADRSRQHAQTLGVERAYGSYEEMAEAEAGREDGIDAVSIVTPNWLHAPAALPFIRRGIHVICDKPMTTTLEDAETLVRAVREAGVVFALTHNYAGYPLIKQARAMVQDGALGAVRKVVAEYSQGWLARPVERDGSKQAAWRTDPEKAGAGALGDIGSHAEHLAGYVTGLHLDRLCADVRSVVDGRQVDDDANVLLRYAAPDGQGELARRACCTARRSPPGWKTTSACASSAPRARSPGRRRSPTRSSSTPSTAPSASTGAATTTSRRPPATPRASPPATPRPLTRPLPTSTPTPSAPSAPASLAKNPTRSTSTSPPSKTAREASTSS